MMLRLGRELIGWSLLGAVLGTLTLAAGFLLFFLAQGPIDQLIARFIIVGLGASGSVGAPLGALTGLVWGAVSWRRRWEAEGRDRATKSCDKP